MNIESLLKSIDMKELNIDNDHYQYQGFNVPRVTEILSSMLHEDYLMKWSNSIGLYGHRKYSDVLEQASTKGTYVHNAIEDYIQNNKDLDINDVMTGYRAEVNCAYSSFREWWDIICKNKVKVIAQEMQLVCPWFGGTLDLLAEINGRIYLFDFKTSNYVSYKYFLQLAAYIYMLSNYYGIEVYGCAIVKLSKQRIEFEEHVIDKSHPDYNNFMSTCENTFLSLVYAYTNRLKVKEFCNNLFTF